MLRKKNFCGLKQPGFSNQAKEKVNVSKSVQQRRWSQINSLGMKKNSSKLIMWLRSGIVSKSKPNQIFVIAVAPRNRGTFVMRSPRCIYTVVRFLRFKKFSSGYEDPMWSAKSSFSKLTVLSVRLGAFVWEIFRYLRLVRPLKKSSGNSLIPVLSKTNYWSDRNCLIQEASTIQEGLP